MNRSDKTISNGCNYVYPWLNIYFRDLWRNWVIYYLIITFLTTLRLWCSQVKIFHFKVDIIPRTVLHISVVSTDYITSLPLRFFKLNRETGNITEYGNIISAAIELCRCCILCYFHCSAEKKLQRIPLHKYGFACVILFFEKD